MDRLEPFPPEYHPGNERLVECGSKPTAGMPRHCEDLRAHLHAGEFGGGSVQPKMEACLRFIEQGGERAVGTSPEHLLDALADEVGTRVRA